MSFMKKSFTLIELIVIIVIIAILAIVIKPKAFVSVEKAYMGQEKEFFYPSPFLAE